MRFSPLPLFLVLACRDEPPASASCELVDWYRDADGDGYGDRLQLTSACDAPSGYVSSPTDCNDADAVVHPNANEVCDALQVDEDCDFLADAEDPSASLASWYVDADGDGFGDPSSAPVVSCDAPVGTADNALDCNDGSAAVSPAAAELCLGGVDEDCDGLVDAADDNVSGEDLPSWYPDADDDGYGADAGAVEACAQPAGYAASGTDCNDADEDINPGEAEVCGNGLDDNCNGAPDGCGLSGFAVASDATVWITSEGNGSVAALGDLDGNGHAELAVGDPDSDAAYVFAGEDLASGSVAPSQASTTLSGAESGDDFGVSLAACDPNGDGVASGLVVGAPYASASTSAYDAGRAYYFATPFAAVEPASGTDAYYAPGTNSAYGGYVDCADFDGNGLADLVVLPTGSTRAVGVWGELSGRLAWEFLADGWSVTTAPSHGDHDGDGLHDYALADSTRSSGKGAVAVSEGGFASGAITTVTSQIVLTGASADTYGADIDLRADLNGDGYADLLVGAYNYGSGGGAFIHYGPLTTTTSASAGTVITSIGTDAFGFGVAGVGDENGDGAQDIAVVDYDIRSRVVLFEGPFPASLSSADATWTVTGDDQGFGNFVASAGDLDGDGAEELAISSSGRGVALFFGGGF